MIPKGKLLALLMAFSAVGGLAATGAFTTVEAERTADVSVDGDANALLGITPNQEGTNDFVQQTGTQDSELQIDLSGGDAQALNTDAATNEEDIITITNNGDDTVSFFIVTEGGLQDGTASLSNADTNAANVEERVNVEFYVDESHVTNGDSNPGASDVALASAAVDSGSTPSAVPLSSEITSDLDTFVDTDDSESSPAVGADYSITQQGQRAIDDTDTPKRAVELGPGESVDVSIYIEINVDDSEYGDSFNKTVLENIVVIAQDSAELDGALQDTQSS
jgi:hypothetical protein